MKTHSLAQLCKPRLNGLSRTSLRSLQSPGLCRVSGVRFLWKSARVRRSAFNASHGLREAHAARGGLRPGFSGAYWRAQEIPACNVRLVNPKFRLLNGNGRKRMASGAAAASNCGIRAGMGPYKSQARRAAEAFPDVSGLKFSRFFGGCRARRAEGYLPGARAARTAQR